ncbi:CPBP family intramembrane glutamic endopeptidase [Cellulomonas hominis]|uniref:CPBP family intramembrane glutamic endopeptidase n=1 Tax=Cellulomonas hominis TaxID=156981 RepID=UPI001BCAF2B6|nr:CPBP family intramembrane glutamic endopeptidase [Cellulomonas hominis]
MPVPGRGTRAPVRPRVWIGLAIWLGYLVLVFAIQRASGIRYDTWGDSARNLFLGAGLSLIVSTVALVITTSLLGWWGPALRDEHRSRHRWPLVAPALAAVAVLMNLGGTDWGAYSGAFLGASLVLLLVGFTEELVNRGLLLTALRGRLAEVGVWFWTSLLFAVGHFINVPLGASAAATVPQVLAAFLGGTIFYVLRRTTGSLIGAMVLHGLWDFSVFATGVGEAGDLAGAATVVYLLAGVIALASVGFVIKDADNRAPVLHR